MNTATPSVLIQCLLIRAGGTKIDLYGNKYHFKPESDAPEAPHVAAIPFDHAAAVHRLLSITGYALVDKDAELPPYAKPAPVQTIHSDRAAAAGDTPPSAEPVIIEGPNGQKINLTAMERPELAQFAQEHFQIKVHHKWKSEGIIAKIIEAMRADSSED